MIYHIDILKYIGLVIFSIYSEKAFEKNLVLTYSKNSLECRRRKNLPQHNKGHIGRPSASIILDGEIMKAFLLRSGTRQGCPLLPLVFSIVLESLAMP